MNSTVDKILDAAERLFAERGFSETSLRTITTAAGVNLAAVNYHFGSKKDLIQAVFARFLDPLELELKRQMAESDNPSVEQLLVMLQKSALKVSLEKYDGRSQFMRLLGFAYNQSPGHVRKFIMTNYGKTYTEYIGHLRSSVPSLSDEDFFWRSNFMLGAFVFTVSSYDAIAEIGSLEYGRVTPVNEMLARMAPVVQAMFEVKS